MSDFDYSDDLAYFFGGSVRYAQNKPEPKPVPTSTPKPVRESLPERQSERNQPQRPQRPLPERRQVDISNDPFGADHE